VSPRIGLAIPSGPRGDDDAHQHTFSEIGPAESVMVSEQRVMLYQADGTPLTRQIGFKP
jgi:hypothetical protein